MIRRLLRGSEIVAGGIALVGLVNVVLYVTTGVV
jgi:hypothetical protein